MDNASIGIEIAIIIVLIFANGIFALAEMSIVSSRKARLEKNAEEGSKGAQAALNLAEDPTPMLSTIQVGITLIGILTGTFGGAALSKPLAEKFKTIPMLSSQADGLSVFLVVTFITYFSLIFGELVPKRIALNNPEPIAATLARPMQTFAKLSSPIVHLLSTSTKFVLRTLGIKPVTDPPITEDEIRILLEQGTEAGTFEKEEQNMVDHIFRLGDLRAYSLMTPRTKMTWLDIEEDFEKNLSIIAQTPYSHIPVGRGSLDDFIGIVFANNLLVQQTDEKNVDLAKFVRTPLYIPKFMKALKVLELFKQSSSHEAVVLDEFGGVIGFLTLHDILEEIIGDMPLSDFNGDPQINQRDDGSWLIDGLYPIEDFKEKFEIDELPDEDRDHYHTVGGFVTSYLGHIPTASDKFEWNHYRFEILDMDRIRVDKILLTKINNN